MFTIKRVSVILALLATCLLLTGCGSQAYDLQDMLVNLSSSYPAIWRLVTAISYVMGFMFAAKAVFALKVFGESRTMMSQSGSLKEPIAYLIAAAALIYAPTIYHDLLLTSFGTASTSPLSMAPIKNWSAQAVDAMFGLVQVAGVIAFIRGWVILAKAGESHGQPGLFGKGLTHVIGGILCINIMGTYDVLSHTIGFS